MEHTNLTRRLASGLTAALLATGALTGVAVAAAPPAQASAPAASDQAARFQVDFLTGMIDHHHMAVMMAEMCVEKAVHDELAATCESIVATQSAEIATMQQWLEDRYGISHEPDMTGMQSMHRFHDLDGEEFEVAFATHPPLFTRRTASGAQQPPDGPEGLLHLFGLLVGHGGGCPPLQAVAEVFVDQHQGCGVEGVGDSSHLGEDRDAVGVAVDHPGDPADLPLDAPQPAQQGTSGP